MGNNMGIATVSLLRGRDLFPSTLSSQLTSMFSVNPIGTARVMKR